jgi:hypothetical protein
LRDDCIAILGGTAAKLLGINSAKLRKAVGAPDEHGHRTEKIGTPNFGAYSWSAQTIPECSGSSREVHPQAS